MAVAFPPVRILQQKNRAHPSCPCIQYRQNTRAASVRIIRRNDHIIRPRQTGNALRNHMLPLRKSGNAEVRQSPGAIQRQRSPVKIGGAHHLISLPVMRNRVNLRIPVSIEKCLHGILDGVSMCLFCFFCFLCVKGIRISRRHPEKYKKGAQQDEQPEGCRSVCASVI